MWSSLEGLSVPKGEHKSWPPTNRKGVRNYMIRGTGELSRRWGDLVRQTYGKWKCMIQDRWEHEEYQVVAKPYCWFPCLQTLV